MNLKGVDAHITGNWGESQMADNSRIEMFRMATSHDYQKEIQELTESVGFMEGPARKLEEAAQQGNFQDALAQGRILRRQLMQIQLKAQDTYESLDMDIREAEGRGR